MDEKERKRFREFQQALGNVLSNVKRSKTADDVFERIQGLVEEHRGKPKRRLRGGHDRQETGGLDRSEGGGE